MKEIENLKIFSKLPLSYQERTGAAFYILREEKRVEDETRLCQAPRSERLEEKKFLHQFSDF